MVMLSLMLLLRLRGCRLERCMGGNLDEVRVFSTMRF